jgi:hypothetical protein
MGAGGIANGMLNLVSNAISCVRYPKVFIHSINNLLRSLFNILFVRFRVTGETTGQRVLTIFGCFLGLFLFGWLITGSVWVYSIASQVSFDPSNPALYCKNQLYSFAFWSISVTWIFMLVALMCICGLFALVLTSFCS